MKLLSRFIWLIIAILAIVFAGVALFQIKAVNEFELIKNSIKSEYDVQVDKMLQPDFYGSGFCGYMSGVVSDQSTALFLQENSPDPGYVEYNLHNDILQYSNADAIWFVKPDNTLFYFKTMGDINQADVGIPFEELKNFTAKPGIQSFYSVSDGKALYCHAEQIVESDRSLAGYVIMASELDKQWIEHYTSSINNSDITVYQAYETLPEISSQTIRIVRNLNNYDGQTVALLNIELHLPFLSLWDRTSATDKWFLIGSLSVIVLFLIFFLINWVISPLKRISSSLQKGDSNDIQPLTKSSTELGEVARMIADYHKKTDELEASKRIKRYILEKAQVGIIISNASSGIILTTNPYACQLIDAPDDAVLGNVTNSFLSPLKEIPETTEGFESTLINSKGQEIPVLRTATKIKIDCNPVIMKTFVDLSEIKSLQDKLQEEKKKLSLAVQNSGLAFCEYDFTTDKIIIDDDWHFIVEGKSNKNLDNFINNIHESDLKTLSTKMESVMKGAKNTMVAEFRVKHPERGNVWINVSILITRRDENHQPKQLIGLIDDITERIMVQQELIKAKEKAEESDRMKSSYLGNMNNKIRIPLNTIVGFANLLSEEELDAAQKNNFIGIIRHDTEQVLRLIDDMIHMTKIDAHQLDIEMKPCAVNKIIANLAEYYKANDKTRKIKFELNTMLPDGKDIIETDASQLEKALNSLLSNAFKFTSQGEIELGYFVNPVDKKLIFYVKDTGAGIPEASKEKIFNRFYQVNPLSEGTGLGLTLTQSIVHLLGGKISFETEENKGSKFYIELPFKG